MVIRNYDDTASLKPEDIRRHDTSEDTEDNSDDNSDSIVTTTVTARTDRDGEYNERFFVASDSSDTHLQNLILLLSVALFYIGIF